MAASPALPRFSPRNVILAVVMHVNRGRPAVGVQCEDGSAIEEPDQGRGVEVREDDDGYLVVGELDEV